MTQRGGRTSATPPYDEGGPKVAEDTNMVRLVREAAAEFTTTMRERFDQQQLERDLGELRKTEVGSLIYQLDSVRAWLADLFEATRDQVEQFSSEEFERELESAGYELSAAGDRLFRIAEELDPETVATDLGIAPGAPEAGR